MIICIFLFLLILGLILKLCKKGYYEGICLASIFLFIIPMNSNLIPGVKFFILVLFVLFIFLILNKTTIKLDRKLKLLLVYYCFYSIVLIFIDDLSLIFQIKQFIKTFISQFLFGLLLWYAFSSINQIQKYILLLEKITFFLCICGIVEYVLKFNFISHLFGVTYLEGVLSFVTEDRGILSGRIAGTTVHPLNWGQWMGVLFMFFFIERKYIAGFKFVLLEFLCFLNVFLTGSRSALLPIIIFLVFPLKQMKVRNKLKIIVSILCVFLFTTQLIPQEMYQKMKSFIGATVFFWDQEKSENADIHGSSIDLRLDQLIGVFFLTESNVLTGQGYGYQYFIQSKDPYIEKVMFGFESIVLNKILEQGLIGLVLYLIFFILFWRIAVCNTEREEYWLLFGFINTYLLSLILTGERASFWIFFACYIIILKDKSMRELLK